MADAEREDRTLPPSERRLQKARDEGEVPRARELAGALLFGAAFVASALAGSSLLASATGWVRAGLTFDKAAATAPALALERLPQAMGAAGQALGPLLILLLVAAVAGPLALGGWRFTWKPLVPAPGRFDVVAGLGRLISGDAWVELLKSTLKSAVILGVAAWVVLDAAAGLSTLGAADPLAGLGLATSVLLRGSAALLVALVAIAALDVPLALFTYRRRLRMTRREAQDEQRETEGDPQVKARIRSLQRAVARRRMMAAVPGATVVVTNPTHFAVAIAWHEGLRAPRVVAKGAGEVALRIREIAAAAGVPLLEAPALARALHRHVDIESDIPPALYQAVAQVLAWVFQVKRAAGRGEREPAGPADIGVPQGLDPQERSA